VCGCEGYGGGLLSVGDVWVVAAAVKKAASQMLCKGGDATHAYLGSLKEEKAFCYIM